ncbi:MAG: Ig-like domain-containing protein [Gemmatimonadaceae bacterium]
MTCSVLKKIASTALIIIALDACGGGSDGGPSGSTTVASVTLNAPSLSMIQGDTATLVATAKDGAGNTVAGNASWKTSSATVATVTSTGLVTAVAPGSATITGTVDGRAASLNATASAAPNSVLVLMSSGDLFSPFHAVIAVNGTVNFEFPQRTHNVAFDRKTGVPPDIPNTTGATIARKFNTAGVYTYACTLHLPGMVGEVEVR